MDPASNVPPARVMAQVAKAKGATRMGYIQGLQGRLGNKDFVSSKAEAGAVDWSAVASRKASGGMAWPRRVGLRGARI